MLQIYQELLLIWPKYLLGTLKVVLIGCVYHQVGCVKNQGRYPNSWSKNYSKNVAKFGQKIVAKYNQEIVAKVGQKIVAKFVRKNVAKFGRKNVAKLGQKMFPKFGREKLQKSAEKSSARKCCKNRPGHSCDQFLPAMNSQSSINRV